VELEFSPCEHHQRFVVESEALGHDPALLGLLGVVFDLQAVVKRARRTADLELDARLEALLPARARGQRERGA
jgi:hypothetical protein